MVTLQLPHFPVLRHSFWYFPLLFLALNLFISACDEADGPVRATAERPVIADFSVDPSSVRFSQDDGIRDTLVTFHLEVVSELPEGYRLVAGLASVRNRTLLSGDTLQTDQTQPNRHTGSLGLNMNTSSYENLIVYVYPLGPDGQAADRVESTIIVRGVDTGQPEVLEIIRPDTVYIPAPDEDDNFFLIGAKVGHTVAIENINQVRLELFDSNNNRLGDRTYIMKDVFSDPDNVDFETEAGDSIYVQDFSIDSGTPPASFRIEVHAVDVAGTISDTLQSTLTIAR